jgi:hypothetical protein
MQNSGGGIDMETKINVRKIVDYISRGSMNIDGTFQGPGYGVMKEGKTVKVLNFERVQVYDVDNLPGTVEVEVTSKHKKFFGYPVFWLGDERWGYSGRGVSIYMNGRRVFFSGNKVMIDIHEKDYDKWMGFLEKFKSPGELVDHFVQNYFPWINRDNLFLVKIDKKGPAIWYRCGKRKMIDVQFVKDKRRKKIVMYNVLFREGVYDVEVPFDYNGPDPLAFESINHLPDGAKIKKRIIIDELLLRIMWSGPRVESEALSMDEVKIIGKISERWAALYGDKYGGHGVKLLWSIAFCFCFPKPSQFSSTKIFVFLNFLAISKVLSLLPLS